MASSSNQNQQSSITSFSSLPPRKHDVFLSFRGEDTRQKFTDHLFSALVRLGFCTYRDDDNLERGEDISTELLKAIEGSRVSVIVFSRNYADSRWCLDELVKIMECKRSLQQMVVPVFYDVDPTDVRAQRGSFGEAFERHQERYGGVGFGMEGKLEKWRKALAEAANLSGWDLQDGHESKFIDLIVEDISNKLNIQDLNVATYPIGIESRVQQINWWLSRVDVHMIGIWGIPGIGKTTIAKAIYNLVCRNFEGSSFLQNVREISKQPNGLVGLQEQLLSDVIRNKNRNIRNVDHGIEVIKQRLQSIRVLLVLDDVDDIEQLKAFAIGHDRFHSGSKVIVTTRDEFLLNWLKVEEKYMPKPLDIHESLQLFSWHAFGKDCPIEDYVKLSKQVVHYTEGLPLALEVLGSFLSDKSMHEWKSALGKLKVIPHDSIYDKLKISFDSLNAEEKELFLDIACFFVGMDQHYVTKRLEGHGFFPEIGVAVLCRRCLVGIDRLNQLTMHDMIADMGREIVRREHLKEPGKRSRLWFHEDVVDVLRNNTGTEVVEGMVLDLSKSNSDVLNAQAFAKMNRLRLLKLNYVHLHGSYEHLSKRLRWLCWYGFPLESIPLNLTMEKVVAIDMRYSNLKQVWKGTKILNNLKFLDLSHSYHLTETPDFSGLTSLEVLLLNDCTILAEVHQSIGYLDKLVHLDLENCKNLRMLPLGVCKLNSLQKLILSGCSKIQQLLGFKGSPLKSWFSIFSSCVSLCTNPDYISQSPVPLHALISLRRLDLKDCNLSYVPDELGSLISLQYLNLSGNNFYTLPASIGHLSRLKFLSLDHCASLISLLELPRHLIRVYARCCTSLERISFVQNYPNSLLLTCSGHIGNFGKSLLQYQGLYPLGQFSTLLSGGDVLGWFDYQSIGGILAFEVPQRLDRQILGVIICAAFPFFRVPYINFTVRNRTKFLQKQFIPVPTRLSIDDGQYLWIDYIPHRYLELHLEAGNEMEFQVAVFDGYAKKCGVSLIYEDQ